MTGIMHISSCMMIWKTNETVSNRISIAGRRAFELWQGILLIFGFVSEAK